MALRQINVGWNHVRTYETEAALLKRIEQDRNMYPEHNDRFLIIRAPNGRWTAVVSLDVSNGGYLGRYDFIKI